MHQDPGERSSDPTRDWPRLACECPGVSGGGVGWRWPAAGSGALRVAVCALELLKKVAIIFITSTIVWSQVKQQGGNTARFQQKIGLKIFWAWPRPSEQDPVSPTVSLSHQEASISLLSFSIRGRQNENHNHRKLIKLITWTTALSNSMKLWAMPCRATQDGRVMVESSDKTWSTGEEGMANHFSILALRTPWIVWKGKKIGRWKMNSPGW